MLYMKYQGYIASLQKTIKHNIALLERIFCHYKVIREIPVSYFTMILWEPHSMTVGCLWPHFAMIFFPNHTKLLIFE